MYLSLVAMLVAALEARVLCRAAFVAGFRHRLNPPHYVRLVQIKVVYDLA